MAMLSSEEKLRFLKALEEDEEFRLAVAGLLGFKEILYELKKLREDFLTFIKEQEKRWEENNKRWEENNRRWEENNRRWDEAYKRFEAIESELKKLREDFLVFVKEQEKRWEEANRRFSRIELELGSLSESVYSRYVFEDLKEEIVSRGERIISRLRNADFDGVEVDLLIATDRAIYVIEVKTKPSIEDVDVLLAKAEVAQQKLGKPVSLILTGTLIGKEVEAYAKSKGIKVYRY